MNALRTALCLALIMAVPGLASAQDEMVVSTTKAKLPTAAEQAAAKAKSDAAAVAAPASTPEQKVAWLNAAAKSRQSGATATEAAAPDKDSENYLSRHGVHGTAGVSIGTGGYRSAYVSSVIPVGDNGYLGLAYSQTDFGENGGYRNSGYYDGGYGYSRFGRDGDVYGYGGQPGGYGQRGRSSKSVALSYMGGAGNETSSTPEGCAPGFRDGANYIEPVWVTRMHGNKACGTAQDDQN